MVQERGRLEPWRDRGSGILLVVETVVAAGIVAWPTLCERHCGYVAHTCIEILVGADGSGGTASAAVSAVSQVI